MSGYIQILRGKDSLQFHALIVARNGKVLSTTEPMKRKRSVINNLDAQMRVFGCKKPVKVIDDSGETRKQYYLTIT